MPNPETTMTTFVEKMEDGSFQSGLRFSSFTDERIAEMVVTAAAKFLTNSMNKVAPGAAIEIGKEQIN